MSLAYARVGNCKVAYGYWAVEACGRKFLAKKKDFLGMKKDFLAKKLSSLVWGSSISRLALSTPPLPGLKPE